MTHPSPTPRRPTSTPAASTRRKRASWRCSSPSAPVIVQLTHDHGGDGDAGLRVRFEIGVHRASALRIEAFLDHDGDGRRGPTEMPLTDIEIEVSPGTGAGWRMRTKADGSVELGAVVRAATRSA